MVGLSIIKTADDICESCVVGKQHKGLFPKQNNRKALSPIELIHVGLCGLHLLMITGTL